MTTPAMQRLPDLAACGVVALFGLAAVWIGSGYPLGTVTRMGAGFMPVATSIGVILLAGAAAVETLLNEPVALKFKWRPVIFIGIA
ncbi:MAG: hypothetical protein WAU86_18100, partial [Oricola sp.]